jgi:hypothetical protein
LGVVKESPYSKRKKNMISQKAFNTWLQNSKSGDRITYYRGYLCDPYLQPIAPTGDRDRVKKLGKSVYAVAEANLLYLTQKKHDDFDYEYMATRK